MNKTVLLACCDFLILATLSLNYNPLPETENQSMVLARSNDFYIEEKSESNNELLSMASIYEVKLSEIQDQKRDIQEQLIKEKSASAEALNNYEILLQKYNALKIKSTNQNDSLFDMVSSSRLEMIIKMTEDDSFTPDKLKVNSFSCAITFSGQRYLIAHSKSLGFEWPELLQDGHISDYSMTIAKSGANPWSFRNTKAIKSLNQNPTTCLIPLPANIQLKALPVVKDSLGKYLSSLYALKADGRLIKVVQATTLPNDDTLVELSEKRFLGQPDNLETGDLILTTNGLVVGLIQKSRIDGNTIRHKVPLLAKNDLSNTSSIPVNKISNNLYFTEFVDAIRRALLK